MTINSPAFVAFLFACILAHRIMPARLKNTVLLCASTAFYAICAAKYLPLLAASLAVNFYVMQRLDACREESRKKILITGIVINIGLLIGFKYLGFFAGLGLQLAAVLAPISIELPSFAVPVGLSFYSLTLTGVLIDVYRGKSPAEKSFVDFALLVSFFPAILSGPIERSTTLLPQLKEPKNATSNQLKEAVSRYIIGLAKKMLVADRIAILVNSVWTNKSGFSGLQLLLTALLYGIQIYADFSAYSDMAVGCGLSFGLCLTENFRRPYFTETIKDFWRNWHISLSTWFRDYLYIPLGGSRNGRFRTYGNLLIVFAVSGLWHGADISFIVWGLICGIYQVAGAATYEPRAALRSRLRINESSPLTIWLRRIICYVLNCFAWIFFRADSMKSAMKYLVLMANPAGWFKLSISSYGGGWTSFKLAAVMSLLLFVLELYGGSIKLAQKLKDRIWLRYAIWTALLITIAIYGAYGSGYNAQDFIYFKF